MSKKIIKDMGASIKQKLLNLSLQTKRPFNEVLTYYMIERFIDRLSKSPYKNRFVLKGALMFVVWDLSDTRATRDIDLLGKTQNTVENMTQIIQEICRIDCLEDAAIFMADSVECQPIQEQNEYQGIRVYFNGELAKAKTRMQIDIGFGDIVFPKPSNVKYPTMLGMAAPAILGYTPETLIAEKTHAMVRHGLRNSRMKDYFDVWILSNQFLFEGAQLAEAIQKTFLQREMEITDTTIKIFDDLVVDNTKKVQWNSFVSNNVLTIVPDTFEDVIDRLKLFIVPIFERCIERELFNLSWQCPGPWQ
jgi:hypothetical protein